MTTTDSYLQQEQQRPFQKFQVKSSLGTVSISTHFDQTTLQYIVLWRDIQQFFKNIDCIMHGEIVVFPLTDKCFEILVPERIAYHPGVVLEIVETQYAQHSAILTENLASCTHISGGPSTILPSSVINDLVGDDIKARVRSTPTLDHMITTTQCIEQRIIVNPKNSANKTSPHVLSPSQLNNPCIQAIISNQDIQMTNLKDTMNKGFVMLNNKIDNHMSLQEQVQRLILEKQQLVLDMQWQLQKNQELELEVQRQLKEKQELVLQLQKQMDKKQESMLHMQQEALNRLAIIQSHVQAVLTQTYELHEYPIPRLFIVLPKPICVHDKVLKPFADQFRLYFLCECGEHTKSKGSTISHNVHMAKHEGYDLEKPTEFFRKYGPYILMMMQMIKYGCAAAGVVVPALSHFKIIEGIEKIKDYINVAKKPIGSLLDETITFLQEQQTNTNSGIDRAKAQTTFINPDALKGADLRQLELYLKAKDQSRVLGNLYRIVTLAGHVKWVCIDHFSENYRETSIKQLKDVVASNKGEFIEERGEITIKISSAILARQFYKAIVNTCGIQVLHITLAWDATMDDLQKLADAVTKANIICLDVYGNFFRGPVLDFINSSHRYEPIVKLMGNGWIQSLQLKGFTDLFGQASGSSIIMAPRLRTLSLEWTLNFKNNASMEIFKNILNNCPFIANLEMWVQWDNVCTLIAYMEKQSIRPLELDTITFQYTENSKTFFLELELLPKNLTYNKLPVTKLEAVSKGQLTFKILLSDSITKGHISSIIRQYGQFLKEGDVRWMKWIDNDIAAAFDVSLETGSKLTTLILKSEHLNLDGLECMNRVIGHSMLEDFDMEFKIKDMTYLQKLLDLLTSYSKKLKRLLLYGGEPTEWMPILANAFPTRQQFLMMESFKLNLSDKEVPRACVQWLATMASCSSQASMHPSSNQLPVQDDALTLPSELVVEIKDTYKPLKEFGIYRAKCQGEDWTIVIRAIEFSELEELGFWLSNFSLDQLQILVNCIPNGGVNSKMPLRALYLNGTPIGESNLIGVKQHLLARVKERAPDVMVFGL